MKHINKQTFYLKCYQYKYTISRLSPVYKIVQHFGIYFTLYIVKKSNLFSNIIFFIIIIIITISYKKKKKKILKGIRM